MMVMSIAGFCVWFEVSSFEFALASEITGLCLLHELWHYKVCICGVALHRISDRIYLVCMP